MDDGERTPSFEGRKPVFLETSVSGIFAAGDIHCGSTEQVASAAGEGATADLLVHRYLKRVQRPAKQWTLKGKEETKWQDNSKEGWLW